jgi:hypothetical protein
MVFSWLSLGITNLITDRSSAKTAINFEARACDKSGFRQRFAPPIDYCFKHHDIYLLLLELVVVECVPEEAKCYNNHWVSG